MKTLLLSSLLLCFPAITHAEVVIYDIGWQLAPQVKKLGVKQNASKFHGIRTWLFPPSQKTKIRARASVILKNTGRKSEPARLLKYSFNARLRKIGEIKPGVWTVPFQLEERHIPNIKAASSLSIGLPINRVALNAYLNRMYRAGYWPDAFRVRVMLEPRAGEGFSGRVREDILSVIWETSSGKIDERSKTTAN